MYLVTADVFRICFRSKVHRPENSCKTNSFSPKKDVK